MEWNNTPSKHPRDEHVVYKLGNMSGWFENCVNQQLLTMLR